MIYISLFLTFLKIGAVSFGGGYAMISLIRESALANGWLTEEELLNIIAVAESTPGPIAVNMATFVGSSEGGLLGSLLATLGVVLPSFIVILIIASLMQNITKYAGVKAFLGGIRPCIAAMILTTALTLSMSVLLGFESIYGASPSPDLRALMILSMLIAVSTVFKKLLNKDISPIAMIGISAALGLIFYSF
jgi:chromate transporter